MALDNFTGVYREYHDEEKTQIKSEYEKRNKNKLLIDGIYNIFFQNNKINILVIKINILFKE